MNHSFLEFNKQKAENSSKLEYPERWDRGVDENKAARFGYYLGLKDQHSIDVVVMKKLLEIIELTKNVLNGCSDGNCILRDRTGGQHTNGGCRCKRNAKSTLAAVESKLGELK